MHVAAHLVNSHLPPVDLCPTPWYHGPISRATANSLLTPLLSDGLFLIRESSHYPGHYTLTLCHNSKIEHFHISCEFSQQNHRNNKDFSSSSSPSTSTTTSYSIFTNNKKVFYSVDGQVHFSNLQELVDHYSFDRDGLPCKLNQILPKKGIPCYPPIILESFHKHGWLLPIEHFSIQEKIGSGDFAEVYRGIFNQKSVAAKCISQPSEFTLHGANEAIVLTDLHHENLVAFFGLVIYSKKIYLLCEFMPMGNLVNYLRSRGKQAIVPRQLLQFTLDISSALNYLADKKYIHRDIAARNILLNDSLQAKLGDFGLCQKIGWNYNFGKVPVKWTAPEAIRLGEFSISSDIWSFGILMWEIFSFGKLPYHGISVQNILGELDDGLRLPMPEDCPPVVYSIMFLCWNMDPYKRPSPGGLFDALNKLMIIVKNAL